MPVTEVLLKVSPVNDIAQAVSVDVTSDILSAGKTIYNVGAPSTTRWYFAVLTDGAYVGGAIAPGLQISADALTARTSRLPRIEVARKNLQAKGGFVLLASSS